MITSFELISPSEELEAGLAEVEVEITSDDGSAGVGDSVVLEINGTVISDSIVSGGEGTWTVTSSQFLYGPQSVKIKVTITDEDETKSQVWIVAISAERQTPDTEIVRKAFFLDSLIRYFPDYTKARSNKYSTYRQFINALGLELDRVKEGLHQQTRGLDSTRVIYSDPDWLYQCQLGVGESFRKVVTTSGAEVFEAPTIYGVKGVNRLLLEGKSSFLDFWIKALPHRFTTESEVISNVQLTSSVPISELSYQEELVIPIPGHIYIWIHSIASALEVNPEVISGKLQLEGEGLGGQLQTEEIIVVKNAIISTKKMWRKITKISASSPTENFYAEVVLYNFPPRYDTPDEPIFRLAGTEPLKWQLNLSEIGAYIDLTVSGPGYVNDIITGEEERYTLQRYWMKDASGGYVTIDSFTVDPTGYLMYGVNETAVYIWDRREPVADNLIELNGSAETPEVDFFVEDNQTFSIVDDTLVSVARIEIDTPRENQTIDSWSWSVINPNGERKYRNVDGEFEGGAPFIIFNIKPISRFGIAQSNFTVDLVGTGTWIFELTVNFMDRTSEVIRHPYEVIGQTAIAEYKIDHLITGTELNIITCLEDGQLVVTNSGTVYKLVPMYDSFMIDFETETISFREEFDTVELRND